MGGRGAGKEGVCKWTRLSFLNLARFSSYFVTSYGMVKKEKVYGSSPLKKINN